MIGPSPSLDHQTRGGIMASISEVITGAETPETDLTTPDTTGPAGTSAHERRDLHYRYWQLEVALNQIRSQSTALSRAIAGL